MVWYLLNIAILTVIQILFVNGDGLKNLCSDQLEREKTGRKLICIIGSFNWILLSGLRGIGIGDDTMSYRAHFVETRTKSWSDVFDKLADRFISGEDIKDPGYGLWVKICQVFTSDYQVYLVIIAILFFALMGVIIYRYSSSPYQSFLLFSTLFFEFFAITGIRQTIATAIVVFGGIKFIKERKLIPFLLLFVIAIPIHMSSICFLPFYFISRIKINKGTLLMYWCAIALSFVFRNPFMNFLGNLVGYDDYAMNEGASAGTFMVLLLLVAVVTTLFYKFIVDNDNPIITMSINALFVACIFSSFLLINQNTMRVVQYYSLFLMLLLPELKNIFKNQFSVYCYRIAYVALLVFLLIRKAPVYEFFWM